MSSSRRDFLKNSFAVAAVFAQESTGYSNVDDPQNSKSKGQMFKPAYLKAEQSGKLKAVEEELWEILKSCKLCPRACGTDRIKGETGICSSTARLKVHGAAPHFGEEPPLVGRGGSGTIFFSNCNLLCCFCQNWQINHRGDGYYISHDSLAQMMLDLQSGGCHNINLVTPTHVVPHIIKALRIAIPRGLKIPLVYNTGGYDNLDVIKKLDGIVDIYLPDFKYMDGENAAKYSSGASNYPEVAAAVIKEMHRQVGELRMDERKIAQRGLIIRHLVMPGNIAGTDRFVAWVAKELAPKPYVNIMAQYRPMHRVLEYPEINRHITSEEWSQAIRWAEVAGVGVTE
jgi:putative pyruvate formate lyase activating enzyme